MLGHIPVQSDYNLDMPIFEYACEDGWSTWWATVIVVLATSGGCAGPEPEGPDTAPVADAVPDDDAQEPEPLRYGLDVPVQSLPEPVFQRIDSVEPAFSDPRFSTGSPCGGPFSGPGNFVGGTLRFGALESNGTPTLQLNDVGLRHQISSGWPLFVTCIRTDSGAFWRRVEGGITVELDAANSLAWVTATYRGVSSPRHEVRIVP